VDAILPAYSRILFAITDGGRVRETRARVG
jgi:hypothetical protein